MRSRRFRSALESLEQVLRQAPDSCSARINVGKCHIGLGSWADVVHSLTAARECAPRNTGVLEGLALAKLKLGKLDAARRLYREASRLAPSSARIRDGLALVAAKIELRAKQAEESSEARRDEEKYRKDLADYEEFERKREAWEDPSSTSDGQR